MIFVKVKDEKVDLLFVCVFDVVEVKRLLKDRISRLILHSSDKVFFPSRILSKEGKCYGSIDSTSYVQASVRRCDGPSVSAKAGDIFGSQEAPTQMSKVA